MNIFIRLKGIFLLLLLCQTLSAQTPQSIESQLVVLNVRTGKERVLLTEKRHFEAPNWSRDGQFLIINAAGLLEKIDLKGNNLGKIHPELVNHCNNDHGLSFDGKTLVFSKNEEAFMKTGANSRIYTIPMAGGQPVLVTTEFASYWHGISPDGKDLVYCAGRGSQWDVYKIGIQGGSEIRLTDAQGLDDGPEYSYDGQWIYFNSHRTGRMHLYRMKPDGSQQEQLTFDDLDNWFAHPSPSGRYLAYIAYMQDQKGAHPFGKDVKLRLLDMKKRKIKDLTPVFYGGQGSINVPSWSPDGKWIAFVRYKTLR
jgi:TolB protein